MRCFVGLGSNLGNPRKQVQNAILALSASPEIEIGMISSLYSSSPMGPANQPDFINAVIEIDTGLSATDLLALMLILEENQGRIRGPDAAKLKNGPRFIDLDLLLYGGETIDQPGLSVPHPGLHQRDFVLVPLIEIAPDLDIPSLGPLKNLMPDCQHYGLVRLGPMDLCIDVDAGSLPRKVSAQG